MFSDLATFYISKEWKASTWWGEWGLKLVTVCAPGSRWQARLGILHGNGHLVGTRDWDLGPWGWTSLLSVGHWGVGCKKKKKKGVQKRRSIQQPICIISGTVSHTHSQASERIHLGKAREGLDFKRKMFFAFQRFLMFTIPALLPTQIKDGRGNSLRDL